MGGQTFPGLPRSQILSLLPELQIDAEQDEILTEDGWFKMDHLETKEELITRVKLAIQMFKEMARSEAYSGKTILAVSHGNFLSALVTFLMCGQNSQQQNV